MSVFSIRLFLAIIIFYMVYGMWISKDNLQELMLHFTVEVSRTELRPSSSEVASSLAKLSHQLNIKSLW